MDDVRLPNSPEQLTPPFALPSPDGARDRLPEYVGPFRVVGVLGAEGMGVVYDAEQEAPRRVALEVVRESMLDGEESVRRFAREAEVLVRLQHPGIAQIFATGVAHGPHGPRYATIMLEFQTYKKHGHASAKAA
jgi:serine/threonine protein kinase